MPTEFNKIKFDIIILAGQSNAIGSGTGDTTTPFVASNNIYQLKDVYDISFKTDKNDNVYLDYKTPFCFKIEKAEERKNEQGQKIGCFGLNFCNLYEKTYLQNNRKILLLLAAVGGTGFAKKQWGINDCLFIPMTEMISYALSLNPENRVVAFLWHQGEHDAFENPELNKEQRYNFYYSALKALIQNTRKNCGNIPIICGNFTSEWGKDYTEQLTAISNATIDICNESGNAAFVDLSDLPSNNQIVGNGDTIHFSRQSLSIAGKRYFDAFSQLKNN